MVLLIESDFALAFSIKSLSSPYYKGRLGEVIPLLILRKCLYKLRMSRKQEEGIIHYRSLKGFSAAAAGAGAAGL
jgi:hypothetical protein